MSDHRRSTNRSSMGTRLKAAVAPLWRRLPTLTLVLVLPAMLAALVAQAPAGRPSRILSFSAVLNGGQESGDSVSNAFGVGFFTFDTGTRMLCYAINYTDLSSDEIGAHFHGPALPGEDAQVLIPIPESGSPKDGCVGPLKPQERNMLKRGELYVNVHSMNAPAGEIRGQVVPLKTVK